MDRGIQSPNSSPIIASKRRIEILGRRSCVRQHIQWAAGHLAVIGIGWIDLTDRAERTWQSEYVQSQVAPRRLTLETLHHIGPVKWCCSLLVVQILNHQDAVRFEVVSEFDFGQDVGIYGG